MRIPPFDPRTSPLSESQAAQFNAFVQTLGPAESAWVLGYMAAANAFQGRNGGGQSAPAPVAGNATAPVAGQALTILYGTQTGNAAKVAKKAHAAAVAAGLRAEVKNMADYKTATLKGEKNLLLVISTYGEGDPPDSAKEFHGFVLGKRAPKLEGARFAVLGLGDTSYEHYCKTGVDFDQRLEQLGARRLLPRVDCDLDFEEASARWIADAVAAFGKAMGAAAAPVAAVTPSDAGATSAAIHYDKKNPFHAGLLDRIQLNGRGSAKQTWHLEIALEGSGITYQPGDALGVHARNDPAYVADLLRLGGWKEDQPVSVGESTLPLRQALEERLEVTTITRPFLKAYAEKAGSDPLRQLLDDSAKDKLRQYLDGRELIDVVADFPARDLPAAEFARLLRPLQPRLYSIASSLLAHPDEVHLTVGLTRYEAHGRVRKGVCSTYLAERHPADAPLRVFVEHNPGFKLPADQEAPVIMIGPGTGVAPFRAFVEEREALGAGGRNWLFFGDQHFNTDFLYQTEWQRWLKGGPLSRISLAFSRDQREKIYVQHRLREHERELYAWIQEGAHLYVCGDASKMAADVHAELIGILQRQGGKTAEAAEQELQSLALQKRYQRDVY
jgi:sulfite reductase (NADPH) flavoprotein alpha-component